MMEVWTCPLDFPGYEFSSEGRIRKHNGKMFGVGSPNPSPRDKNGRRVSRCPNTIRGTYFHYDGLWKKDLDEGEMSSPIQGFPGYYITSNGKVYSDLHSKFLKPLPQIQRGYHHSVYLTRNGRKHSSSLSTLVGRHFLEGYKEGLVVCHKDETLSFPHIHSLPNLYLGTQWENMWDMTNKNRGGGYYGKQKLTWDDVRFIRKSLSEKTMTRKDLSQKFRVSIGTIQDILKERTWKPHTDPSLTL